MLTKNVEKELDCSKCGQLEFFMYLFMTYKLICHLFDIFSEHATTNKIDKQLDQPVPLYLSTKQYFKSYFPSNSCTSCKKKIREKGKLHLAIKPEHHIQKRLPTLPILA